MPSVAIVASGLFNVVLLATLLAWQQMDTAPLAARTVSTATWCQPRPAALQPPQLQPQPVFSVPQPSGSDGETAVTASIADVARLENDKLKQKLTNVVAELSKMRASHSAQAVQLREARQSSSSGESFYSSSEARLKRIWVHPPHWSYKEAHNDSWAFLSSRQLSRGVISQGDPLRLSCLAEKLAAGHTIHLSVIGGSVSFGTTFTTSKSRSLFHWKVYQYINASFPQGAHEHFMGAVPASGPSYMEHCLDWHLPPAGADLVLVEYAVNFDSKPPPTPPKPVWLTARCGIALGLSRGRTAGGVAGVLRLGSAQAGAHLRFGRGSRLTRGRVRSWTQARRKTPSRSSG